MTKRDRGAAGQQYAIVVGLVGVVALGAVGVLGINVSQLMRSTGNAMSAAVNAADAAPPPAPPPVPAATISGLSFPPLTGQAWNSPVQSAVIAPTVTGGSVALTVSGDGSPAIRSCSDSACSSVISAYGGSVTVSAGQYLQLRLTTANAATSQRVATVSHAGGSAAWNVTTAATNTCFGASSCVFVTATSHDGNLGGLGGADAKCTADANNPGGQAYALLATDGYNHARNIVPKLPIRRASDGTTVATTANQFFCHRAGCSTWNTGLSSPNARVWTGVVFLYTGGNSWGPSTGQTCNGWTATSGYSGSMGNLGTNATTVEKPVVWMEGNHPPSCATLLPIICMNNIESGP